MILKTLQGLIDKRASYSPAHVLKLLFLISERPMGRNSLARKMKLGEASIKTLLKRLKEIEFIESTTKGNLLNEKGRNFLEEILKRMSKPVELNFKEYTTGKYNSAILVKNSAKKVKLGIEQRDEAIKVGGEGATTLIYKNGKLKFPGFKEDVSDLRNELEKIFVLEDDDVIIIGSASTPEKAEEATLMAALSLLRS